MEKKKIIWYKPKTYLLYFKDNHIKENKVFEAARSQKTPFNLSRYVLLAIQIFMTIATARIYFGWPNMSNILYHYNAYEWLCDDSGIDMRLPPHEKRYKCIEQDAAVNNLFMASLSSGFCFSMVAGTLLDFFGPKITALIGQSFNIFAMVLFSMASDKTLTWIPVFIFIGVGSDCGFLPSLPIANLFPANEGLVIGILGAAKSLSFAVPKFMYMGLEAAPNTPLRDLSLWYMGFGPVACFLLAGFAIPWKSYLPWNEFVSHHYHHHHHNAISDKNSVDELDEEWETFPPPQHTYSIRSFANELRNCSFAGSIYGGNHSRGGSVVDNASCCDDRGSVHDDTCKTTDHRMLGYPPTTEELPQVIIQKEDAISEKYSKKSSLTNDEEDEYGLLDAQPIGEDVVKSASFKTQFFSIFNAAIICYAVVRALLYAFFTTSLEHLVGKQPNEFAGTMLPFSFAFCLVVGKLVDKFGIMIVLYILNTCITLAYGFTMNDSDACGYIAVMFYVIYVGFYSTQLYCYVSETFEAKHFGKFVGITSMISGLLSLMKIPLTTLTNVAFKGDYQITSYIMLGLCVLNFCIIIGTHLLKRKNPHPFWPKRAHHHKSHLDIKKNQTK